MQGKLTEDRAAFLTLLLMGALEVKEIGKYALQNGIAEYVDLDKALLDTCIAKERAAKKDDASSEPSESCEIDFEERELQGQWQGVLGGLGSRLW